MLISNFNLYKAEWLDLVFAKRNKEYGAYYIRQHYAQNLTRALFISVAAAIGGALAIGSAIKVEPLPYTHVVVDLATATPPSSKPKKEEPVKPKLEKPAKTAAPVKTRAFVTMAVTSEPVVTDPPTIDDFKAAAVGPTNIDAPSAGPGANADPAPVASPGSTGTDITESLAPVGTGSLTVMPSPVGGEAAWSKFLYKNLKYPELAIEAEKSGKVWITFVIEKDGTLTDIKVLRGPGYGMDEEALRVLKKAPAWTPGIMGNKPVRVQFTLPINFALQQ